MAHCIGGQAMCYWILPESGIPIAHTTVQVLSAEEMSTDIVCNDLIQFDKAITGKLGDSILAVSYTHLTLPTILRV